MSPFTRREFIGAATVGAAALMAGSSSLLAAARKKLPIGVQLYSVGNEFRSDVPGTLAAIKKIGFDGVEFAGYANYANNASGLRKLLDDNGLKACGTHLQGGLPDVQGDRLEGTVEFNKTIGNDKLIVASVSARTADDWARIADEFSAAAEKLKPHNVRLGYHNHTGEFAPIDGQMPEYIFFDKTSPDVFMQLDIGHCAHGGGDPVAVIKKYGSRLLTVHAKDWVPATRGDIVGEGIVKWPEVLEACANTPALQWYTIEEESRQFKGLDGIEKDFKNLTKLLAA
jgi:sugar phosphate isomerase/epimerase